VSIFAARLCLVFTLSATVCRCFSADAALSPEHLAFFEQKIRPVLTEHCYQCHSAEAKQNKKLKGGLYLDSRAGLLTGGDTGPAIVAGKSDKSLLMTAIRWQDTDIEMPPKKKLPDEIIADFAKWIDMGAPDPRMDAAPASKRVIDIKQGREHWAFKPLLTTPPPNVKNSAWVRTPIDRYILARQESAGVVPSGPINRERLLRRIYFDLTGMPPMPAEVNAFAKDTSPDSYEKVIDTLLSSPRYGEHWGRHWLDVVRYAESGGYEFDGYRPGAYHYRDWVIRALNADMPYDQFVRLQVSGDKLNPGDYDSASATGFIVAGPYPGQITAKTKERIRYDQLDDILSTLGTSMLALTLGCVRCHDHKFDPIPQRDYYALAAAFATTEHGELKIDKNHEETQKKLTEHEKLAAPLRDALKAFETKEFPERFAKWQAQTTPAPGTDAPWQALDPVSADGRSATLAIGPDGTVLNIGNKSMEDVYTVKAVTNQKGVVAFRLDVFAGKDFPKDGPGLSDNGNFVLGDLKIIAKPLDAKLKAKPITLKLKAIKATFEQKDYSLAAALDNSPKSGWAIAPEMGKDHAAIFAIDGAPVGFEGGTELEFQMTFDHFGAGRIKLSMHADERYPAIAVAARKAEGLLKDSDIPYNPLNAVSASARSAKLAVNPDGTVFYTGNKAMFDVYTVKTVTQEKTLSAVRLEFFTGKDFPHNGPGLSDNGNFVLGDLKIVARPVDTKLNVQPLTLKLAAVKATFEQGGYPLNQALDDNPKSGWGVAPELGKDHAAIFSIDGAPAGFVGGTELEFQMSFDHFGVGHFRLSLRGNTKADTVAAKLEVVETITIPTLSDASDTQHLREIRESLKRNDGKISDTDRAQILRWFTHFDETAAKTLNAVRDHDRNKPRPELINVYTTKNGGQDVYLLRRGEVDNKDAKSTPGYIQVLLAENATPPPDTAKLDPRVALGNWLTDTEKGAGQLLARVIVNRMWKYHFGKGIVATPNDFGQQGGVPTHPELLDYLAQELIKSGWKMKTLHRQIMLSAVYLQGSDASENNRTRDPENKLWWQRPSMRLNAEAIRDALLSVGGKLDESMFGPAIDKLDTPRRSVYLRVRRSELIPFMTMFDAPEPTQSIGDRGTTTLPTQALTMMNSSFARKSAEQLRDRVMTAGTKPRDGLLKAFQIALGRQPSETEVEKLLAFFEKQKELIGNGDPKLVATADARALAQTCLILLCMNEFVYVD